MRRAIAVAARGAWPEASASGVATLRHDDRHRRRLKLRTDAGEPFLLDLARPARLADGDGLALDDGSWVLVRAAEEDCVLVRCADRAALTRVAWHLGNRHLAVQILADGLLIRHDHVIVDMVRGLGAETESRRCAFDPEAGAYGDAGHHHHDHDHDDAEGGHRHDH
jgi:urease accessory protein